MTEITTLGSIRQSLKDYPDDTIVYKTTTPDGTFVYAETPEVNKDGIITSSVQMVDIMPIPMINMRAQEYIEKYLK